MGYMWSIFLGLGDLKQYILLHPDLNRPETVHFLNTGEMCSSCPVQKATEQIRNVTFLNYSSQKLVILGVVVQKLTS